MKPFHVVLGLTLTLPAALAAQTGSRSPKEASEAFRLELDELPADDMVASGPSAAASEAVSLPQADSLAGDKPPVATTTSGDFTLDTPIGRLIADPQSRAVLDRHLPGLSTDENLPKFRSLSLRAFQPMTGGQLTDALLAKTAADLAAIRPARKPRFDSR